MNFSMTLSKYLGTQFLKNIFVYVGCFARHHIFVRHG